MITLQGIKHKPISSSPNHSDIPNVLLANVIPKISAALTSPNNPLQLETAYIVRTLLLGEILYTVHFGDEQLRKEKSP